MGVSTVSKAFVQAREQEVAKQFADIEKTELMNAEKVLAAMQRAQLSPRHFAPSTGYGYDDIGRDTLGIVFAEALGAELALVRPQFASGTHAITTALFGLLLPGEGMLSGSGMPYDTLRPALGIDGKAWGALPDYNIGYSEIDLVEDEINIQGILETLRQNDSIRVLYFQRSRGYAWRSALRIAQLEEAIGAVKQLYPGLCVVVDNCYGEFVEEREPCDVGADIIIGSLIKNPGGGLAPTGAYIAGRSRYVDKIAGRMTSPGIGAEVGSYAASYLPFFQGFFFAPHVVAQALKGAVLAARCMEALGYESSPAYDAPRGDIIQAMRFGQKEALVAFCQSIQSVAPVDSHVRPEPWDMPGYAQQVIMAAGAFVQGASIELSADGPIRPPYTAYMQGGLYYAHVKLALCQVIDVLSKMR